VELLNLYKQSSKFQEDKAIEAIQENSKFFFNYAKKKSKIKTKIGPLSSNNGQIINKSEEMAEMLAQQYSSVFSNPSTEPPIFESSVADINNIQVTPQEIIDAISEIKPNSAAGPDGFPAVLLRNCKEWLAQPLAELWNLSMSSNQIPQSLKTSIIPPIHKGGSKADPANYRPVALTSHLIKVYEKVIRARMTQYLEDNNFLNDNQHGFRPGRSCLTQLLAHYDKIISLQESGLNVDVVYLDFSKAFDKVDHNILLCKLKQMGIDGNTLKWLHEFLSN